MLAINFKQIDSFTLNNHKYSFGRYLRICISAISKHSQCFSMALKIQAVNLRINLGSRRGWHSIFRSECCSCNRMESRPVLLWFAVPKILFAQSQQAMIIALHQNILAVLVNTCQVWKTRQLFLNAKFQLLSMPTDP